MRKLILMWLFRTDNIEDYIELLHRDNKRIQQQMDLIDLHLETLDKHKEDLDTIRKLIKVCENHGINVDEEIKKIEL